MAKSFYMTDGSIGISFDADATTTPQFTTGEVHAGTNSSEWVYVQASSAVAVNDCVALTTTAAGVVQAAPVTKALADDGAPLAVAPVAIPSGSYAWVARRFGSGISVNVLANCVADVPLYTTATAGKLDDDATSQTLVRGIRITTTTTPAAAVAAVSNSPMGA
jgi:hypothetical protein